MPNPSPPAQATRQGREAPTFTGTPRKATICSATPREDR